MSRTETLEIAKAKYAAYRKADLDFIFGRGEEPKASDYNYHHGWVILNGFSFNGEELTGVKYDITQGGWAYL